MAKVQKTLILRQKNKAADGNRTRDRISKNLDFKQCH